MVDYLTRADWGARPAGGKTQLVRSRVQGIGVHYPGMGSRKLTTQAQVASALRGWQDYHMDDRGWSDIAYQVAVDQAGRPWTLRGLNIQSAANGDQDVNQRYGAILLIIGDHEPLSAALKSTTRAVIADFRRWFPAGTLIRPHSAIRPDPTSCPGDLARAAISRGELAPGTITEDDMSAADVTAITTAVNAAANRLEKNLKDAVEASGRRWALYQRLYELETADDIAAAQAAYVAAKAAGKSEAEALAAAESKLSGLRQSIKEAQANA